MTANYNTNHQIMKMKTEVNCLKIAEETSSDSTHDPPFSKNISNNIGKNFLILIQKHFPNNHKKYNRKIYYGSSEGTFKRRCGNHKKSFNYKKHRTDAKLSKEYRRLKELKAQPQVQFCI